MIQTTSTVPSFNALSAAEPATGTNVAVSAGLPPFPGNFFAGEPLSPSHRPNGNSFAFELRQLIKLLIRGIKNPEGLVVGGAQRQNIGRTLGVGDATSHETYLNA